MRISESVCLRPPYRRRLRPVTALLLWAAAGLTACQPLLPVTPGGHASTSGSEPVFRPDTEYLTYMHALAVALPDTQKGLYRQAAEIHRREPTPHHKLRFALSLGLLDAPYGDAAKARQLYRELLQSEPPLPSGIESILQIRLAEIKQRTALEERLALLQQKLDKAEAKIQALTTIEKNLEQPSPEARPKATP